MDTPQRALCPSAKLGDQVLRKPRALTHGLEFLMDERDHTAILISLAQDAVPVDELKLNQLRLKFRDVDERIATYRPTDA